jgi:rhodanese-related sulfurtransferase
MNIKSSQSLVEDALKTIKTLKSSEVKKLAENNEITLIDVRDIREIWKEGTIENSKHIPRGMLEFWLDPESTYYQANKIKDIKKNGFILCTWTEISSSNKIFNGYGF